MKMLALFTLCFVLTLVSCRPDTYTDEFDDIDVDEVLANPRLVDNYIHCIKTGQKCTPDAIKARELLPDALQTRCAKCTEKQKIAAQKILEWAIEHKPDVFLEVEAQHDPNHKYRKEFADELKARNIVLPELK